MNNILLHLLSITNTDIGLPNVNADQSQIDVVLKIVFALSGSIALFYVTYAGFKYTTSGGDGQATAKAKNQIIYGVIGLVISLLAYSIVGLALSIL